MNLAIATLRSSCLVACWLALAACSDKAATPAPSTPPTDAESTAPVMPPQPKPADPSKVLPPRPTVSEDPKDHPAFKVETLKAGEGAEVTAGKWVRVRYVGTLLNGKEFDSSWRRGVEPAEFALDGVVPGFRMGLMGMKVGEHRRITIPGDLGYGVAGSPGAGIGPNATLFFDVELEEVKEPPSPPQGGFKQ